MAKIRQRKQPKKTIPKQPFFPRTANQLSSTLYMLRRFYGTTRYSLIRKRIGEHPFESLKKNKTLSREDLQGLITFFKIENDVIEHERTQKLEKIQKR